MSPFRQESYAIAAAMSSGSGNQSASETAKSRPITANKSSASTSRFLKLLGIRGHENSTPRDSQSVRIAELESSPLIHMFPYHSSVRSSRRRPENASVN